MKTAWLVFSIFPMLFCACSPKDQSRGEAAHEGAKERAKERAPAEDDPFQFIDFQALKRTVVQETVDGLAFSVELPEHPLYKKEIKKHDGTFPGFVTWQMGFRDGPGFTAQPVDFPASADTLRDGLHGRGQTVTLAEALPA